VLDVDCRREDDVRTVSLAGSMPELESFLPNFCFREPKILDLCSIVLDRRERVSDVFEWDLDIEIGDRMVNEEDMVKC
jgi:hypothetical protein